MIRTQKRLFVATLLALQFSGINSFATSSQCISSFVQTAPAAVGIPADLSIFKAATPLKNGGIAPGSKILNQKCSSICWAYGLNELVDQMLLTNTGVAIETSPDHNGFWHFYFQIQNHASYFTRLANKIQSGQISLEDATREAINLMKMRPFSKAAADAGFVVHSGSNEPTALNEAKVIGIVPTALYDRPIVTPEQADDLDASLKNLVSSILSSPVRKTMFGNADADGINTPLFQLMTQKLSPVLNAASTNGRNPYRPNDTFIHTDGKTYTPITFMKSVAQFDPDDFVDVHMTAANQAMVQNAVVASLSLPKPIPVPIGFAIFNQEAFQKSGVASSDIVSKGPVELAGGHLTLIENVRVSGSSFVGVIFKNSWGPQGLNANGTPTLDPNQSGYNGITSGYLKYTIQQDVGPDFLFHISVVNPNSQYSPLLQ